MRNIKFRVWDTEQKCLLRYFEVDQWCESGTSLNGVFTYERFVFQQFTGLLDKNGKEIYEGDIYNLKDFSNNPYFCVWYDGIYWNRQVKDTDEEWLRDCVNVCCDSQHDLRSHCKFATVIGNIFQNPELLTQK